MKHSVITMMAAGAVTLLASGAAFASVTTNANGAVVYDNGTSHVYASFLTTTETVVCTGCRISEISSISATMKGGYIGTPRSAVAIIYDRTETSFTVQFQIYDALNKTVRAYFRQQDDNIVGRADKAGYDDVPLFSRLPDDKFTMTPATAADTGTYGVYNLQFFGHPTWTADGFPVVGGETADLVVSNGTLQVNVAASTVFTNAISGNGAVVFKGENSSAAVTNAAFDAFLSTSYKVVLPNTRLQDVEVVSGVLDGSWITRVEGAIPYNVATNADGSVYVQLQKEVQAAVIKGVSFQMAQQGNDVVAKALKARQAGSGQGLGSNLEEWNGATPSVATSATASGYGIETINFRVRDTSQLWLRGPKSWTGGTVVDDLIVNVETNKLPARTRVRIVDGGEVVMRTDYAWNVYPWLAWEVGSGCRLANDASFGVNMQDTVSVDGGVFEQLAGRITYANHLDLANGAKVVSRTDIRIGYWESATWTTAGDEPITVEGNLKMYRETGNAETNVFTIDAGTDILFAGAISQAYGYRGSGILKTGSGTATFSNTVAAAEGTFTLQAGAVAFASTAAFGALCVAGDGTIAVGDGASVAFGESGAIAWESGATVNFTGALDANSRAVRFGTTADGLTREQLRRVRVNGEQAALDENGYLHEGGDAFCIVIR